MCKFRSCAFCCVNDDDGTIVDCPEKPTDNEVSSITPKRGYFKFREDSDQGELVVFLNNVEPESLDAIAEQSDLVIDEDITNSIDGITFVVLSGSFQYDTSIGDFGGYVVPAIRQN